MKKLFTLFLALAGVVSTMSAKTIYFIDNWGRTNLQLYAWKGESNNGWVNLSSASSFIGKDNGWCNCYELNLEDYDNFIIRHDEYDGRTQTPDLTCSAFTEGKYYEYKYENNSEILSEASLHTYSFNVTTASSWDEFYIYLWNTSNKSNISGAKWPGIKITGIGNSYTYTFKSYINTVGVLFDQGESDQGQKKPQTCDFTASEGEANYFIASVTAKDDSPYGEAVKTNSSGYATFVSTNALTIPSGIAYCAEEPTPATGSAMAKTVTNPESGTAMLIKGNGNTTYHFAVSSSSTSLSFSNAFKAGPVTGLSSEDNGKYNYILNGDAFYAAAGKNVASNKAYLQLSTQAGSAARILIFPGDDEAQGITTATTVKSGDATYYNLSGQRVNAPSKGLYIHNGKKMIVK